MKTPSTRTWDWRGVDAHGAKVQGEISAPNLRLARAQLQRQGVHPQRIHRQRTELRARLSGGVSGREMALFTRQLATMLSAGIPLVQALELMATATGNPRLREVISAVAREIAHGAPVYEALAHYPAIFDPLYRHLVQVGESTGTLETVLQRLATERERREQLKGRLFKALAYPALVMVMALVVCLVMLIYVVPQFEHTFADMGAQLPAFTQGVVSLSRWLGEWWWALLVALGLAGFGLLRSYRRSPGLRRRSDRLLLRLPLVGGLLRKAAVARFARALATTVQAGVPLLDALGIIEGATGNRVFAAATARMMASIRVGGTLHAAMHASGLFAPMAVQMVAIGDEAGALDTMLHKLAGFHEEDVGNAVDTLSSLLEPAIMLLIGVVVGGLVIAMYLPVFNLAPSV